MSAFAAAAALGATGHEGQHHRPDVFRLALATFARMATSASGVLTDPAFAPLVHWLPIACWGIGGALLLALTASYVRARVRVAKA